MILFEFWAVITFPSCLHKYWLILPTTHTTQDSNYPQISTVHVLYTCTIVPWVSIMFVHVFVKYSLQLFVYSRNELIKRSIIQYFIHESFCGLTSLCLASGFGSSSSAWRSPSLGWSTAGAASCSNRCGSAPRTSTSSSSSSPSLSSGELPSSRIARADITILRSAYMKLLFLIHTVIFPIFAAIGHFRCFSV